jgi:hypothetical protein
MTSQLSWQPPTVTKCGECPKADRFEDDRWCTATVINENQWEIYEQNKDGITPTCPMWQQQNKEKTT